MLNITITDKGFVMQGHCGYAQRGQDIVCASISSLYLTFLACTDSEETEEGDIRRAYIVGNNPDDTVVFKAIANGIRRVAEVYPDYVKITE